MGTIRVIVAVLDIHMEAPIVQKKRPMVNFRGLQPIFEMIIKATRVWRFEYSNAIAIIKPPRNIIVAVDM